MIQVWRAFSREPLSAPTSEVYRELTRRPRRVDVDRLLSDLSDQHEEGHHAFFNALLHDLPRDTHLYNLLQGAQLDTPSHHTLVGGDEGILLVDSTSLPSLSEDGVPSPKLLHPLVAPSVCASDDRALETAHHAMQHHDMQQQWQPEEQPFGEDGEGQGPMEPGSGSLFSTVAMDYTRTGSIAMPAEVRLTLAMRDMLFQMHHMARVGGQAQQGPRRTATAAQQPAPPPPKAQGSEVGSVGKVSIGRHSTEDRGEERKGQGLGVERSWSYSSSRGPPSSEDANAPSTSSITTTTVIAIPCLPRPMSPDSEPLSRQHASPRSRQRYHDAQRRWSRDLDKEAARQRRQKRRAGEERPGEAGAEQLGSWEAVEGRGPSRGRPDDGPPCRPTTGDLGASAAGGNRGEDVSLCPSGMSMSAVSSCTTQASHATPLPDPPLPHEPTAPPAKPAAAERERHAFVQRQRGPLPASTNIRGSKVEKARLSRTSTASKTQPLRPSASPPRPSSSGDAKHPRPKPVVPEAVPVPVPVKDPPVPLAAAAPAPVSGAVVSPGQVVEAKHATPVAPPPAAPNDPPAEKHAGPAPAGGSESRPSSSRQPAPKDKDKDKDRVSDLPDRPSDKPSDRDSLTSRGTLRGPKGAKTLSPSGPPSRSSGSGSTSRGPLGSVHSSSSSSPPHGLSDTSRKSATQRPGGRTSDSGRSSNPSATSSSPKPSSKPQSPVVDASSQAEAGVKLPHIGAAAKPPPTAGSTATGGGGGEGKTEGRRSGSVRPSPRPLSPVGPLDLQQAADKAGTRHSIATPKTPGAEAATVSYGGISWARRFVCIGSFCDAD